MIATKRPLYGNGEPILVTATSSGTAQTIYVAAGVSEGWDQVDLFATNATNQAATLRVDVGGSGTYALLNIPANTAFYQFIPKELVFQGGLTIKVYASAANRVQIHGTVTEVRVNA